MFIYPIAIFKEQLSVVVVGSVNKFLWSKILKSSYNLADETLQENVCHEAFCKKKYFLGYLH